MPIKDKTAAQAKPAAARVLMDTSAAGVPLRIGEIAEGTPAQIADLVKAGAGDANREAVDAAESQGGMRIDIRPGDPGTAPASGDIPPDEGTGD